MDQDGFGENEYEYRAAGLSVALKLMDISYFVIAVTYTSQATPGY